jgi:hypothetical protein
MAMYGNWVENSDTIGDVRMEVIRNSFYCKELPHHHPIYINSEFLRIFLFF